jgi:hypothetical protein
LYLFCPFPLVLSVLNDNGRQSQRQRRLPALHVVSFVIACSLFRDKSLPNGLAGVAVTPLPDSHPDRPRKVRRRELSGPATIFSEEVESRVYNPPCIAQGQQGLQ